MSYRFEIAAGASKKLLVGGKYCEEDIIVTALGGSDAPDIPDAPVTPEYSEGLLIEWTDWRGGYEVNGRGDCTDSIVVIPDSFDDGVHGESPVIGLGYTENDKFVYVFYEDDTLVEIYLPYGMALGNSASLTYCPNLKKVYGVGSVSSSFELVNLPSLEYVEFTPSTEWISGGIGSGSGNGAVYDFSKCTSIPSFGSYGFGEEFGTDPVIVVPENLLEEWKQATNWTLYADYIVAEGQENAQEKTIEITENGTYEVIPDEGKLLRKVTANVAVEQRSKSYDITLAKSSGWVLLTALDEEVLAHINDVGFAVSLVNTSPYEYVYFGGSSYLAGNVVLGAYSEYSIYGIANREQSETNMVGGFIYNPANYTGMDVISYSVGAFRVSDGKYYIKPGSGFIKAGTYHLTFTW